MTEIGKVYKWEEFPSISLLGGALTRRAFRSDNALLVFNHIAPTMRRQEPRQHPFDQIILTLEGRQMVEIESEAIECVPSSVLRVPANAKHTRWPVGNEPVISIDLFAPPRADYLFMVEHQSDYPQPPKDGPGAPAKDAQSSTPSKFSGKMMKDTSDVLFKWNDLPRTDRWRFGYAQQAGFRSDEALVTFNYFQPPKDRAEPHSHAIDQIVLVLEGELNLEIEGRVMHMTPGSICLVPKGVPHTGWPVGEKMLFALDIFSPPRKDDLSLCDYQTDYKGNN